MHSHRRSLSASSLLFHGANSSHAREENRLLSSRQSINPLPSIAIALLSFEDGAQQLYRSLEHDIGVPKYFNFRASTNDNKPKSPAVIGQRLTKLMVAKLEAYASDDRCHVDYARIAASEGFRRYSADFGQDKVEVLNWVLNYLDSTKAGLLSHLLNDGGAVSISYQNFDWSLNC